MQYKINTVVGKLNVNGELIECVSAMIDTSQVEPNITIQSDTGPRYTWPISKAPKQLKRAVTRFIRLHNLK